MEVVAFVGPPGTGKSHRALLLARELGTSALIDDGLFIVENRVVAGRSAKYEPTRMQAVRRALFADPEHAREVQAAVFDHAPPLLLILGTSDRMVGMICTNLGLPAPARTVHIEEVTSPGERWAAVRTRRFAGKHVIPAPAPEVKRGFRSGVVLPLKLRYRDKKGTGPIVVNKSVVRPTYTHLGHFFITESALRDLLRHLLQQHAFVREVNQVVVETGENGTRLAADLTLIPQGSLVELLRVAQSAVHERLEELTGVPVLALDLRAVGIVVDELVLPSPADRAENVL